MTPKQMRKSLKAGALCLKCQHCNEKHSRPRHVCVSLCVRGCVPAWLPACLPACLHACVPACLRAYVRGWVGAGMNRELARGCEMLGHLTKYFAALMSTLNGTVQQSQGGRYIVKVDELGDSSLVKEDFVMPTGLRYLLCVCCRSRLANER